MVLSEAREGGILVPRAGEESEAQGAAGPRPGHTAREWEGGTVPVSLTGFARRRHGPWGSNVSFEGALLNTKSEIMDVLFVEHIYRTFPALQVPLQATATRTDGNSVPSEGTATLSAHVETKQRQLTFLR